jgi:hypothetical protein
MTRKPPPRYPGTLNEPIVARGPFPDERIAGATEAKLELLFEYYQIGLHDRHRWQKLALALAVDHVPGLAVQQGARPKPGRKKTWNISESRRLVDAVNAIESERKRGINDAVHILKKRSRKEWPGKGLEARYYECKKRIDRYNKLKAEARRAPKGSLIRLGLPDYE